MKAIFDAIRVFLELDGMPTNLVLDFRGKPPPREELISMGFKEHDGYWSISKTKAKKLLKRPNVDKTARAYVKKRREFWERAFSEAKKQNAST